MKYLDFVLVISVCLLIFISTFILRSIAPEIFPNHYFYIVSALIAFIIISRVDFEVILAFSPHLYVITLILLLTTLLIGQVTRGAIRWIPLGIITIQPSEVMRAFLILFFAKYLGEKELDFVRLVKLFLLFLVPFILILVQPSLGVAVLTLVGFLGVLLASSLEKRFFLIAFGLIILILPLLWFILAPYQKSRLVSFLNPSSDPLGAGYNSIQSMISVGSGGLLGRGLGQGVQTQLQFLPEKHTDFIFAAISEELGFLGASLTLLGLFAIFIALIHIISNPKTYASRAYTTGFFLILFAQTLVHVGMNMGLLPITGVPLPFVSAGGSSLIGSAIGVAIALKSRKE